jgi:hypothetical protein
MNQLILPVAAGTLPSGVCVPGDSLQALLNLISQYQTVTFPTTFSGLFVGGSPPSDTTQTWLQIDSLGRPVRTYIFAQGAWLSLHPIPPGMIMIWPFATPDFTVFDGGDANALSPVSGPMWQTPQDNSGNPILTAQVPLGYGTLPSGTVIAATSTGGEETHILQATELAPHQHAFPLDSNHNNEGFGPNQSVPNGGTSNPGTGNFIASTSGGVTSSTQNAGGNPQSNPSGSPTAALGHNTLPPYYGVLFIQRTSRLFYSAT